MKLNLTVSLEIVLKEHQMSHVKIQLVPFPTREVTHCLHRAGFFQDFHGCFRELLSASLPDNLMWGSHTLILRTGQEFLYT